MELTAAASDRGPVALWNNRYFWLALALAALLTFVISLISAGLGVFCGFLVGFLLILLALPKRELKQALIVVLILLPFALIALPNFVPRGCKPPSAETKQNLHAIQLAVERYAVDHDCYYPVSMEQVRAAGYMDSFPGNPYLMEPAWRNRYEDDQRQMVNLGEMAAPWQQYPLFASGNFVYAPKLAVIDGELRATGYALYGIGGVSRSLHITDQEDPAFVIIELGEGLDKKTGIPADSTKPAGTGS